MITDEDMAKAWDRIARSADGKLVYAHFQKIAMGLISESATDGALRHNLGRRSLATELMGLMSKGIADSAGPDRALIFTVKPAAAGKPHLSFREHERANLRYLGNLDPTTAAD